MSLDEVGVDEVAPEDAETFEENARFKAQFYARRATLPTLADDSGLEVDALGGAPGVRSHRYAGADASDDENNRKLLAELGARASEDRSARYQCVLAYLPEDGVDSVVRDGTMEGRIARAPRGNGGFGYDPIFEPVGEPPEGRTVGQLSQAEKNRISHRAVAARRMGEYLRALGY